MIQSPPTAAADESTDTIPIPGAEISGFMKPSRLGPRELNEEISPSVIGFAYCLQPLLLNHLSFVLYDATVITSVAVPGIPIVSSLST